MRGNADQELVFAALQEWDTRADVRRPGAIRWLYDDAHKRSRGTRTGPDTNTAQTPRKDDRINALDQFLVPDEPQLRALPGGVA